MSVLKHSKQEYNQVLVRYKKAFKYLSNNEMPLEEREKWLQEYEAIVNKLNELVLEMRLGEAYTNEELQEGFK